MAMISKLRHSLRVTARDIVWWSLKTAGTIRARFPNMRDSWEGSTENTGNRHAVFVHFDPVGQVHDYVLQSLEELAAAGYAITFVSNSPKLPQQSVDLLKPLTRRILLRYNSGYDFAAYRDGMKAIPDLQEADSLILMNDSVYGPLFPLEDVLENISADEIDVWGVTDSWEHNYHIQGYFMLFFGKALRSRGFQKFWSEFPNVNNKWWVIYNAELKLTRVLAREKLHFGVQCPYKDVAAKMVQPVRKTLATTDIEAKLNTDHLQYLKMLDHNLTIGHPLNSTHAFWETLIRDWNCLFLKRELLQKNPINVPFITQWDDVVRDCTDYDPGLIERHLRSL